MGPSGLIAILAGWFTTEMGRQPWVVYGLMRTADASSAQSVTQKRDVYKRQLKHWQIDPSKVKIVNLNPAEIAAAWRRGDIDGAFVWSPALGEIKKSGKVLTDAAEVGQWGAPTFEVLSLIHI